MPTGYTAAVGDGELTDFRLFALQCARGFGALILLRDSDQSLDSTLRFIEEEAYLEPEDGYYVRVLKESKERVAWLESLSDDEVLEAARREARDVEDANERRVRKAERVRARYESMLEKVRAWPPPSDSHEKFKEFMINQLKASIEFDCSTYEMPLPEVSLAWREREISAAHRRIEHAYLQIRGASERNAGRKQWVEALVESLG